MRLYSGLSEHFVEEAARNQIAGRLEQAFFAHFRFKPSPNEVRSWQNSLRAMADVLRTGDLLDHGVLLEYQLPLTSRRLDCLICGKDREVNDQAVIVELKQWDAAEPAEADNVVTTWVGGAKREVLHPSAQVDSYRQYLADTHTAFYEGPSPIGLGSCAYLHNYTPANSDALFSTKFDTLRQRSPTFTADDFDPLTEFLVSRLSEGHGDVVLDRIERSRYRPSKKLMQHVASVIDGKPEYILLDEQRVIHEKVLAWAKSGFHDRRKTVLLVRGGPGTGKSVVALNLMADLSRLGINAQYATGSKAFTETLRRVIGSRGAVQFNYFNSYAQAEADAVDVLICDEAHRIRKVSHNRFTRKADRSGKSQIVELLDAAKVSVFFIDDRQVVRPDEVGSSELVRSTAEEHGCLIFDHHLEAQFRCAGSEGFVNWVNTTLGIERTANVLWDAEGEAFDFRIFDSPFALEEAIRRRAAQGATARLTAGFCWPWSQKPNPDGSLASDVVIDDYQRPWNARHDATRLAKGIPKAHLWAYDERGIDQIGCVYTAQGFEFDYVGVIFGRDLRYDFETQSWQGHKEESHDTVVKRSKDKFVGLVKNTYRVLLSRGLKGCYVYFQDDETERFVRSRIEGAVSGDLPELPDEATVEPRPGDSLPFPVVPPDRLRPWENAVPVVDLRIAAGLPSEFQDPGELAEWTWVELPADFRPSEGQFIARVVGESMNRTIPNGSWCLFRKPPPGSRTGRIIVAEIPDFADPENGGRYTVKMYSSTKRVPDDDVAGEWQHAAIVLEPTSTDPTFKAIEISADQAESLRLVGELAAILVEPDADEGVV